MKVSGSHDIPAAPDVVWRGLNDPDLLQKSISGCESIVQTSPTTLNAVLKAKIGPVTARFSGTVNLENIKVAESYRIVGKGNGGVAGFVEGAADVFLEPIPEGTRLRYEAEALVGGKLAQIGSRILSAAVTKISGSFFSAFSERIVTHFDIAATVQPGIGSPEVKSAGAASPAPSTGKANMKPAILVLAIAAAGALVLYFALR